MEESRGGGWGGGKRLGKSRGRGRGEVEGSGGGPILTIQSETSKVVRAVTSLTYILLVSNNPPPKKTAGSSWKKYPFYFYLFSAYHTETIFFFILPGPKDQGTQYPYQSSPVQQETAPGTASRQNTTKHSKRAEGA